jgi:hypothetical protein
VASPMVSVESGRGRGSTLGVRATLRSARESIPRSGEEATDARLGVEAEDVDALVQAEGWAGLDRRLSALCRERGPLRVVLARVASRLVLERAWERIGYARLSDYAVECLGISGRSVQSLAEVGARFRDFPELQAALASGTLGWTKVRLLARLPFGEDERPWIDYAGRVTAEELSKAVRAVDRGSLEAGAAEDEGARSRLFEVRCTPEVRWKWHFTRSAAKRAAGRVVHVSEAAELIAAEVLSALPIGEEGEEEACEETGVSWSGESEAEPGSGPQTDAMGSILCDQKAAPGVGLEPPCLTDADGPEVRATGLGRTAGAAARQPAKCPPWRTPRLTPPPRRSFLPPPLTLPPALASLLEGLEDADAFALDERLRRALSLEQRLEARIGPLLAVLWGRFLHRALGYTSREAYARERLGMDPTRARALVRLERAAHLSEAFARAYRTGALSWVKADVLAPLVSGEIVGGFVEAWVGWAERITVRRLRDDVEHALALRETDPEAFRRAGGLPPEAMADREIGAPAMGGRRSVVVGAKATDATAADRENGASDDFFGQHHPEPLKSAPDEICWVSFSGPADVIRLFKAVLSTVRRRMEKETGRLPTSGEALGAMLDHVLMSWGEIDAKVAARHKVFARDGWRCATPGCTSMQNLHDHHIRFRSAQGPDALENRITLCAFHHLRGVHAGLLRCMGKAPDGLRWELGIRPGVTPLAVYRSGDLRVKAMGH